MKVVSVILFCVFFAKVYCTGGGEGLQSPYCTSKNNNCQSQQTCCLDSTSNGTFCCDYPNATCCGINKSCCPNGSLCDPVKKSCVPYDNGETCTACVKVVAYLNESGCSAACELLPSPASEICDLIAELGICPEIIGWLTNGVPPFDICSLIGLCSGGTCSCGYCTKYLYGRCLSVPNHCPSSNTNKSDVKFVRTNSKSKFCFDGTCKAGNEGCCLTCF
eukprot:TRINITY_DN5951_c0_g1_i1.p1 TRINITY_DN5951_c0_g1~~TRINITY_DN5951_c0_g1_i1.p1  ORF type:complete len:219 (-),score=8.75 TRINITY_DN5951_c0_g1_i1:19-675(-)